MVADYGVNVSPQTIRRRLNEFGLYAQKKTLLSIKNVKKRLQLAREHIQKGPNFWNMIVWSDESKFNVFGSDG